MIKRLLIGFIFFGFAATAWAQNMTPTMLEINTGRVDGIFSKEDVYQKAILLKPEGKFDTAMLFYRGWAGIANLKSANDWPRNLNYLKNNTGLFSAAGIAVLVMDCPTDENKVTPANVPMGCNDDFRASKEHAEDVRKIINVLRTQYGIKNIYIMGHSYGTVSSRWLAKNLGNEIQGSIHSSAMTVVPLNNRGFGHSVDKFDMSSLNAPVLNIHHRDDSCRQTPYANVLAYSNNNLITVVGGDPVGDVCGGTNLHSMGGREQLATQAIIKWITTKQVELLVGE
jgi:hypothetical protein